jgi:hypothetical protein
MYLLTKEEFARAFKKSFDRDGPVSMGMSDVVIAKLLDENVITVKQKFLKKKWVLNLESFNVDEYYERQVLKVVRDVIIVPIQTLALQTQMAKKAPSVIFISSNGELSELSLAGDDKSKTLVIKEMHDPQSVPLAKLIIQDLKTVVSDNPVEFGEFGTLLVAGDTLLFRVKESVPVENSPGFKPVVFREKATRLE